MVDTGAPLADWLTEHTTTVGEGIETKSGQPVHLPFLFKVLSVNKALSIQSHPTKVPQFLGRVFALDIPRSKR